ncbi:aspartyl protease family protein [Halioxenophilus aromaticivorans]|uniref:Peptidase A2 domain-containing protein n=1 Tax=Halioxenophilus aromaticivorans TaxID=1306992 RepID=A0AAV3U571_9ALTE
MANQRKITTTLGGLLILSVMGNCWQFFSSLDSQGSTLPTAERRVPLTTERATLLQSAMVWLQRQEFTRAITAMEDLRKTAPGQAAELQIAWLQELYAQLENEQFNFVQSALDALLGAYPYNEDYLLLQADFLERSDQAQLASSAYYNLADQPSLNEDANLIANARHLALAVVDDYRNNSNWNEALAFLDQLLWREPEYPPYVLALIQVHLGQGNFEQAQLYLERIADNEQYSKQVADLKQQLKNADQPAATQLALSAQGSHFLAPLDAQNQTLQLMIDTGASLSVVSSQRLASLNETEYLRSVNMNTAGGAVNADVYRLASVTLGPYELTNVEFAVLPLDNLSADGLLGMNILERFRFNIDTEAKTLGLELK